MLVCVGCACCGVQPGRGRRFRVYRACDFRRSSKTLNNQLAWCRSRHSKTPFNERTKRRLAYLPIDRPPLPATLFRESACIRRLLRAITTEDVTWVFTARVLYPCAYVIETHRCGPDDPPRCASLQDRLTLHGGWCLSFACKIRSRCENFFRRTYVFVLETNAVWFYSVRVLGTAILCQRDISVTAANLLLWIGENRIETNEIIRWR